MFRNELGGAKSQIKIKKVQPAEEKQDKRNHQDIPKEEGLLCDECEHNLSVLEGYFAKNVYAVIQSKAYNDKYRIKKGVNSTRKEVDEIDIQLVSLFYQSIIYRQHISNLDSFKECVIDESLLEKLRNQLHMILADNPTDMIANYEKAKKDFHFMPFVNWTVNKERQDDNFLGGVPNKDGKHLLMLNNVRAVVVEDIGKIKRYRSNYSKSDETTLKMYVKSKADWRDNSKDVVMEIEDYLDKI